MDEFPDSSLAGEGDDGFSTAGAQELHAKGTSQTCGSLQCLDSLSLM